MLIRHDGPRGRRYGVVGLCALSALASLAASSPAAASKLEDAYELRMACETGDGGACYRLGDAYETRDDLWGEPVRGQLVKRNDSVAMRYFRKACDMGDAKTCRRLGRMYEFGKGAAKNNVEAIRFYLRACDSSDQELCSDLNDMLER